jgi:hypothetical protein
VNFWKRPIAAARSGMVSLAMTGLLSASVSVSPSSISNTYTGALDLNITGLNTAGQTVVVEDYFDVDGSGTVTAPDLLLRKFQVTDGQASSIAGQRNYNVPGDEDGTANKSVSTRLLLPPGEVVAHIPGAHLFRVSPAGTGFTPFTTGWTVTQQDYSGSGISGTATASAGGTPLIGAVVLFFAAGSDQELAGMTVSGAGGAYTMKLPPGSYQVAAARSGYIFNAGSAGTTTVTGGSFTTGHTLALDAAQRTISGTVRNAATLAPLTAVPVFGQSDSGFLTLTFADGAGNYTLGASAGSWKLEVDEISLARFGCLGTKFNEGSSTSVSGFNLDHPAATSLIHGSLRTPANGAVPFAQVECQTNGSPNYKSSGVTNANGDFAIASVPAAWRLGSQPAGYLVQDQTAVVNTDASAVLQNLVANPVTTRLRGQIRDDSNNPVGNVVILAVEVTGNSNPGINATTTADANGNFDLGVFGGGGAATRDWTLQLNQDDGPGAYVSTSPVFAVQDGADINGIHYLVYQVTAHIRGQVVDESNSPFGNVSVYANGMNGALNTGSQTDGGGNFDIGLFAGNWQLGLSNIDGLGLIPQTASIAISGGVDQNGYVFHVRHASGTISGTLKNTSNSPIDGVTVTGSLTVSGVTFTTRTTTAPDGSYSLPVSSGSWDVSLDGQSLSNQGYQVPAAQTVFVTTSVSGVNFTATSGTSYASYQATYFSLAEQQSAISGPDGNPSGDGIVNLLKYAFNLDPHQAIGTPPVPNPAPTGLPIAGLLGGSGGPFVTLTYRRLDAASDLTYAVEQSSTLATFTTATVAEDILSDDGKLQVVRAKLPIGANGKQFLRVRVTKTP